MNCITQCITQLERYICIFLSVCVSHIYIYIYIYIYISIRPILLSTLEFLSLKKSLAMLCYISQSPFISQYGLFHPYSFQVETDQNTGFQRDLALFQLENCAYKKV